MGTRDRVSAAGQYTGKSRDRGQAYLEAGPGLDAAEFQKVLDHRGIVLADPIGAIASRQLGRACVVSGEVVKAVASVHPAQAGFVESQELGMQTRL